MLSSLSRNWWIAALRGMFAILLGLAAFVWPGATLEVLILPFGAYALVDGATTLLLGVQALGPSRALPSIIGGLIGIVTGVVTFAMPGLVTLSLVYVVAAGLSSLACFRSRPPSACATSFQANGAWLWVVRCPLCSDCC